VEVVKEITLEEARQKALDNVRKARERPIDTGDDYEVPTTTDDVVSLACAVRELSSVVDGILTRVQALEKDKHFLDCRCQSCVNELLKDIEHLEEVYKKYTTGEAKYYHDVWCSASRDKPMGCSGCSCTLGREIKVLRLENSRLKTENNSLKTAAKREINANTN
jgi:hypothetical protein